MQQNIHPRNAVNSSMPHPPPAPLPPPQVHTCGDRRRLEFQPGMVQSEMLLSRPTSSPAALCARHDVLYPVRAASAAYPDGGTGGGSLLKFCHRHLPDARITVLELRADVIALRGQFMLPPDDARLRIIETDAVSYIRQHPGCADVLLLDGYDETGLPPPPGSARFYADCLRALLPGGVLVANLFSYDEHYPRHAGTPDADLPRRRVQLRRHRRQQPHHLRRQAGAARRRPCHAHRASRALAPRGRAGLPEPPAARMAAMAPAPPVRAARG
jgi:hypothetical protein